MSKIIADNELGKRFIQDLERVKKNHNLNGKGEKIRQFKTFEENPLPDIVDLKQFGDSLKFKNLFIGNFGRKVGFVHRPIEKPYFRFVLHFGSPEIYYLNSQEPKIMLQGYGFVISPQDAMNSHFSIYSDPIRVLHKNINNVPKIRSKDYSRTTLIYDYEFIMPVDGVEEVEEEVEEVEEGVEDVEEKSKNDLEN